VKRAPGLYWVQLQRMTGQPTVALWTGFIWLPPINYQLVPRQPELRVRKVLSGRLTPPDKDWLPSPPTRVLLDTGKGYREELNVDRVNHATGAVYVSRRSKP
jgi:hypothetical protein